MFIIANKSNSSSGSDDSDYLSFSTPYLSLPLSFSPCSSLFIYVSISVPTYLFLSLSIYLSLYLSIDLSIYLSVCLSISLSIYLSIYLSITLCVSIYVFLYICLHYLKAYISTSLSISLPIFFLSSFLINLIFCFSFSLEVRQHQWFLHKLPAYLALPPEMIESQERYIDKEIVNKGMFFFI